MMAFIKLISIDGTELCVGEGETGTLNRDTTMRYSSEYTNYVPNLGMLRVATGRVGSGNSKYPRVTGHTGRHLQKYPRVTGNTGNCPYLVRAGSRVGSHGSGNLHKNYVKIIQQLGFIPARAEQ